jgi:hypothetical protein
LGNDNGPIVYITTFNNILKNEEDMHFFPCLHYIYMNWYPLVINSSHFICTLKYKPISGYNTSSYFQNLFTYTNYYLPTCPIKPMFHKIVRNIQLHKQLLHYCIFHYGVAMTKQMKNQSKLDKFFFGWIWIVPWVTCCNIV